MKVKIGDTIYDSEKEPICIILDDDDQRKILIRNLVSMYDKPDFVNEVAGSDNRRFYCEYPDGTDKAIIEKFIDV